MHKLNFVDTARNVI